jgi:DNA-binding MarR family transcriptional regulator
LTSDETENLRVFLRDHVSSFEELEVLLFFVRGPRHACSLADLGEALSLSKELLKMALAQLMAAGLPISSADGSSESYRYTPDAQSEQILESLRDAYDEQRLTILRIMSSNAMERVRSTAARRLADAFRLDRSKK